MHAISVTMEKSASSGTEFVSVPLLLVKDEPHDDPEMADSDFGIADGTETSEPDPMNLLDPMMELHTFDTTDSETLSEQQQTSGPSNEQWQDWMAEFPWLLHEDEDEHYGYCLYCNNKTSFKVCKNPRVHAQTRNHMENAENYLAFKESEEHANLSSLPNGVTIKQEFGTDSNISAIKFKRMSQTEPLFNFNWHRWLRQHPWLERDKDDITFGNCKYCKVRLCVEFSYMRNRHELSAKHKFALAQCRKKNDGEFAHSTGRPTDLLTRDEDSDNGNEDEEVQSREQSNRGSDGQEPDDGGLKRKNNPRGYILSNPWLEMHNNFPQTCRCKICNVKMYAGNFRRHLKSHGHLETEKNFKSKVRNLPPNVKQEFQEKSRNWKMYAKKHPWLTADPDDPSFGYCKYCKKRMLYALYPVKRILHEQSAIHVSAAKLYKNKLASENASEESERENSEGSDHEVDEKAKAVESADKSSDSENEASSDDNSGGDKSNQATKSRAARIHPTERVGTDEWYALFPWCKRYGKDGKFMFCTYCKLKLKMSVRRKQHEKILRHQEAAKALKDSDTETNLERSKKDKRIRYFPWLIYTKNPKYVFCKYCNTPILASANRTKHEMTLRHKELAKQFLANNDGTTSAVTQKPSGTIKRSAPSIRFSHTSSLKNKLSLWKNRFPWLSSKKGETQLHYGFCKYCEMRVFVPTDKYAMRHQKSMKHMRIKFQLKRQNIQAQVARNAEKTVAPQTSVLDEITSRYPWIEFDKTDPTYGLCKYCNVRLNVTGVLKDRHEATIKHSKAKLDFLADRSKEPENAEDQTTRKDKQNSSIVVVEDDVLNESASVKSEPMDAEDILNYLIQRPLNVQNQSQNNANKESANKRSKSLTQDPSKLIDRAKRLTAAHLEILRLSRDLNQGNTQTKSNHVSLPSSIFNTSAAIAALLSPQRPSAPPPAPKSAEAKRNNFELFFDSVCESVKTLPTDLAAEGKIKIAQLVAELELRALNRSQSKEPAASNQVQVVATAMPSTTASSPSLSAADVPSTTTNGLEKDDTLPATHNESMPTASFSYSVDQTMSSTPLSSTPIQQNSASVVETSGLRRILQLPMDTECSFKRVKLVSPQKLLKNPQNEVQTSVSLSVTSEGTTASPNWSAQSFSAPSQPAYQQQQQQQQIFTQQYTSSSSSLDKAVTQRFSSQPIKAILHNTAAIDNGFRRIHLSAKPNPTTISTPTEMGFRRIHIPLKGTTITKTSNKLTTPTFYINKSNNS